MARVTVEDCIDKVDNRFELVLLAGHRARAISAGSAPLVDRDNDKNPVVALREIAEEHVSPDDMKEELIHTMQRYVEVDEPEEETAPMLGAASKDTEETPAQNYDRISEEELLRGLESLSAQAGNRQRGDD